MSFWKVSIFRQIGGIANPSVDQLLGSDVIENLADDLNWDTVSSWGYIYNHATTHPGVSWDNDLQSIRFTGSCYSTLKNYIEIDPLKTYFFSAEIKHEVRSPSTSRLYVGGHREDENHLKTTVNYDYSVKSGWYPTEDQWVTVTKTWTPGLDVRYATGWKAQLYDPAPPSGTEAITKYWWPGGLWNYTGDSTSTCLLRNLFIGILDWTISGTLGENRHTIYAVVYDLAGNISNKQSKQIIVLPSPFQVSSGIDWTIGEIGAVTIGECN